MKKLFDLISRHIWLQVIAVALVLFGVSRMVGASLEAVNGTGRLAVSPTDDTSFLSDQSSSVDTSSAESAEPSVDEPDTSWPSGGFGDWNTSEGSYSPSSTTSPSRPSTSTSTSRPVSQPSSQPPVSQTTPPPGGPDVSFVESGNVSTDPTGGMSSEPGPVGPGGPDGSTGGDPSPAPGGESSSLAPGMDIPGEFTSSGALTPGGDVSNSPSGESSPSPGPGPGNGDTPLSPGMDVPGEFTSSGALTPGGN